MTTPDWLAATGPERLDTEVSDHFTIPAGLVRDANQLGNALHAVWRSRESADEADIDRSSAAFREQLLHFDDLVSSFVLYGTSVPAGGRGEASPPTSNGCFAESSSSISQLLSSWSATYAGLGGSEQAMVVARWR